MSSSWATKKQWLQWVLNSVSCWWNYLASWGIVTVNRQSLENLTLMIHHVFTSIAMYVHFLVYNVIEQFINTSSGSPRCCRTTEGGSSHRSSLPRVALGCQIKGSLLAGRTVALRCVVRLVLTVGSRSHPGLDPGTRCTGTYASGGAECRRQRIESNNFSGQKNRLV